MRASEGMREEAVAVLQRRLAEGDLSVFVGAGPVLVGRDPGCAIVLDHPTVSRRHAELVVRAGICRVRDLGSANGTSCGGRAVRRARVRSGDAVAFGLHAARLVWDRVGGP